MDSRKVKVQPVDTDEEAAVEKPKPKRIAKPWHLFRFATALDWLVLFVGILFATGNGVIMPMLAIIFGDGIAATAPGVSALDAMSGPLKWFGIVAAVLMFTGTVWNSCFNWVAERQAEAMRKAYLQAVLNKDMSWFDTNNPEELPSRMAGEVQTIQDALGAKLGQLVLSTVQFFAGLTVAFTRGNESWKMTLVICSSIPLFGASGIWLARTVAKSTDDKQTFYARAGAVAEEVLMSMRTIASFGGEERSATKYHKELYPAKRAGLLNGLQMGLSFGLMMASFACVYAVAFWFGASHMTASGAEIIMVFFSVVIGVMSLMDIGDPIVKLSAALTSGGNMLPVLDEKTKIEAGREDMTDPGIDRIQEVVFDAVTFRYPSRPDVQILKGISLSFKRGQKIALVGESGSGKSTVVQLLERFYDPGSGSITVNGRTLSTLPLTWWRNQIGYVGQEPVLFATSVRKNIVGSNTSISDAKVEEICRQAQAWDFLDALPEKLNTYVGIGGGQMSGGQKQRIAIARALMRQPQILLLDEATSALDNESEKLVQATIDKLQAEEDSSLTTISVAHRLSTIRNAHLIFFLKFGVVAEQGSHDELMAMQGDYFALVKTQESAAAKDQEKVNANDVVVSSPTDSKMEAPTAADLAAAGAQDGGATPAPVKKAMTRASTFQQKSEKEIEEERLKQLKEEKYSVPWSRLIKFNKPEWILYPIALLGCILAGLVMPFEGYILANVTEVFYLYVGDALAEEVNKWALLFVAAGAAQWTGEILKWGLFTYAQESMILRLRDLSFRSLLRQDVGFYDDPANTPAGLTTTLERQCKQVSGMTGITAGNGVGSICSIITGLVFGFLGSWKLTAVCLALVPAVMIGISVVMMAQMGNMGSSDDGSYSHAGAVASEAILNIRTVRALLAEKQSLEAFSEIVHKVAKRDGGVLASFKKGFSFGFGNAVSLVIYIVGFYYGAKLVDDGEITQSEMFESMYCVMFGLFGATMAVAFGADAAKGKLAAYDIFKIIDRQSKVDAVNPSGTHRSLGDGVITFENIIFHYPHRPELPVLKGLNFQVTPGQTVALVGPSGSGKSTVIQLLQRFYDPTQGSLKIGGVDLKDFDIKWWRTQVSLVGQEPVLFNMSLEDNVKYGLTHATRLQVEAAARKANMDYALNGKVQWEDNVGLKGGRLSGGQKQRCAIARAIIREPAILLLDEATSALDSVSEQEVQKALDAARAGRTTFTIAHRLSTIKDSEKIVVINQGVLAEQGTHDELIALGGVYANLARKGAS